jgi:hypothetical protein
MITPETQTHIEMLGLLGSGIAWLIKRQENSIKLQTELKIKVETMWLWFTQHGHEITGYKPGDEEKHRK